MTISQYVKSSKKLSQKPWHRSKQQSRPSIPVGHYSSSPALFRPPHSLHSSIPLFLYSSIPLFLYSTLPTSQETEITITTQTQTKTKKENSPIKTESPFIQPLSPPTQIPQPKPGNRTRSKDSMRSVIHF